MITRLGFYRLRNAEVIRYLTQLMTLMAAAGDNPLPLREAIDALQARLDALNAEFKKDPGSEQGEALLLAEEERDDCIRGFYRFCESFTYLRNPALHAAGRLLVNTIEVYGTGAEIAAHTNNIETTELESLLDDLRKPAAADALALLHGEAFVTPLAAANSDYERLYVQRTADGADPEGTARMKKLRAAAGEAYDNFTRKMSAAYEFEGAAKWGALAAQVNALSEQYRDAVARRAGTGTKKQKEA